ncbi:Auxin-induced in root cultures protein 12 [Dichanthelium oligosanthes]|uniref:Auxin-induced in root cultures protein 12 n=1 Tax=Dichanthelium oligosanthes TaxID=888268 RepID=A0A1E5VYJ7_9POAL|nr:Auxin-induced in root cultures protein 12 [Dichanthelium oligosanthes]
MASTTPQQFALLLLVVALPAAMSACAGEHFPPGRTYVTCQDLPYLGAALHWTYNASDPSMSLAFVAAPAAPGGWVAWGINPTGSGMVGSQALVALVGDASSSNSSSAPAVRTYNITGYSPLGKASTPIAFQSTGLAADAGSGGKIRLYATLQLDKGMKKVVNHVWQVGSSVTRGAPDMHAMDPENLASKGKFVLSDGATASPPAPAGDTSGSGDGSGDASSTRPPLSRPISRAADTARVSAPALVVLALLGVMTMSRW